MLGQMLRFGDFAAVRRLPAEGQLTLKPAVLERDVIQRKRLHKCHWRFQFGASEAVIRSRPMTAMLPTGVCRLGWQNSRGLGHHARTIALEIVDHEATFNR